ncbi:MAG: subunit of gyrase, partial [Paenibacillus sp.]|nr:subunit of gyrase [Paenibacillus sp.]
SRYPNLLVNGVSGISSGFATEIPPHNLREVIDACIALIDNADMSLDELMQVLKGPDFPTGGISMGSEGIKEAYRTGKGRIYLRAKTDIEELKGGRQQIAISEIPYQVVKSKLVTAMETIRIEKKVEGIAEVRDESGRNGLRIVVELKKDADAHGILTYLLKKTDLQVAYSFNMVAIVNKTPKQFGVKEMLEAYIEHQIEVVTKRTQFDLEKAEDREEVLNGLVKALSILDAVIQTIRASKNRQDAQKNLIERFAFTERQADAILTLQLYRLTNLEITSLEKELKEVQKTINYLRGILSSKAKLMGVIKTEMKDIRDRFGIARRSAIQEEVEELRVNLEVMVTPEDVLVTLSNDGYLKRTSMLSFTRSGGETESSGVKENDFIQQLLEVNTIDSLLLFSRQGLSYVLPVHQIPEYKWKENGTAIVNVIPLAKEDRIVAVIPIKSFEDPGKSLLFVSRRGQVKRTELKEYQTNRSGGLVAIKLGDQDEVLDVLLSDNTKELLLVTKLGMSIRFKEMEVNPMGRAAVGVRGIQMREGDEIAAAQWVEGEEGEIWVISDHGYAKSSLLLDYPVQGRGGKGIVTFEFKEGKRVKPNGTVLTEAFFVKHALRLTAIMKSGAQHTFSTEQAPIEDRKSIGKPIVPLEKGDAVVAIIKRTTLT